MSINWVMLSPSEAFVRLPNERILYTSPPRTSLTLQTPNTYPGSEPLHLSSSTGVAYITNLRIVYLPASATPALTSFSAPILNLHDTHVSAPFFGPNVWTAVLQPVNGGGIPPTHSLVELKMTFKDGGAFDFHSTYERIKEMQQNAVMNASEAQGSRVSTANLANINLEQLPAYEESHSRPLVDTSGHVSPSAAAAANPPPVVEPPLESNEDAKTETRPTEPPPGYEEVQRESVASELERRLRG